MMIFQSYQQNTRMCFVDMTERLYPVILVIVKETKGEGM